MDTYTLHREEQLEAEIRALRTLSESVIAGSDRAAPLARAAKVLLGEDHEDR